MSGAGARLSEVGVGVAVINERVQEFGCLPNCLVALLKGEVLLLFAEDVIDGLLFVILAIEFGYAGRDGGVVLTEFFLALSLFIAACEETIPFFKVVKRMVGVCRGCAMECDAHRFLLRFLDGKASDASWARRGHR